MPPSTLPSQPKPSRDVQQMANRIACSPLTGRILMGRLNKAQDTFVSEPTDVTSDFFRALVEKAEFHSGAFVLPGSNGDSWEVTVTKRATQSTKQTP